MKDYQDDPPAEIAASAWKRGYLKPLELFRIVAWKTAQSLGYLTVNSENEIESRTKAAIDSIRPWKGRRVVGLTDQARWDEWRETAWNAIGVAYTREGLLGLNGVGYPVATAILDILDPDVWPVIDKWAVQTVFKPQPDGPRWPTQRWQRADAYKAYARHLATEGAKHWGSGCSIHQLDVEAMNASKPGGTLPHGWTLIPLPPLRV